MWGELCMRMAPAAGPLFSISTSKSSSESSRLRRRRPPPSCLAMLQRYSPLHPAAILQHTASMGSHRMCRRHAACIFDLRAGRCGHEGFQPLHVSFLRLKAFRAKALGPREAPAGRVGATGPQLGSNDGMSCYFRQWRLLNAGYIQLNDDGCCCRQGCTQSWLTDARHRCIGPVSSTKKGTHTHVK